VIFSVIGHAHRQQTRYAIAADTRVLTGLPPERPDLDAIDRRLAELPLHVRYRPMDRSPVPAAGP